MDAQKRRKRRGKPGDLHALKRELWHAVVTAADLLDSSDPELKLRAVHAVSQSSSAYKNLVETADLETRIAALEAATKEEEND